MALLLASVAGFVDAVGFLTLSGLFTAHMSGNTARLGVRLGQGQLSAAVPFAGAVALFVAGVGLGAALAEAASRRGVRSVAALQLALQAALVAAFMLYGSAVADGDRVSGHSLQGFYVLAALAIVALGLQTSSLSQIGGSTVRTTYISGVLTRFAQEAVNSLAAGTRARERPSYLRDVLGLGSAERSRRRAALMGGIAALYLAGAVAGSLGHRTAGLWSLSLPLALLVFAALLDARRPINPIERRSRD